MTTSEEGKSVLLAAIANLLSSYDSESLAAVTFKSVKEQLGPEHVESLSLYKDDVKSYLFNAMTLVVKQVESATSDEVEELGKQEKGIEDGIESEDDDEAEVADEPAFAELPDEWKAQYGNIVWVRTSKSFPWYLFTVLFPFLNSNFCCRWPAYIFDPAMLAAPLKVKMLKRVGKAHAICFYGTGDFDFPTPKQILPFQENVETLSTTQKMGVKLRGKFTTAVEQAQAELLLPAMERFLFVHKTRRRAKKKKVEKEAEGAAHAGEGTKKSVAPDSTATQPVAVKKKRPEAQKKKMSAPSVSVQPNVHGKQESTGTDDVEEVEEAVEEGYEEEEEEEAEFDENDDDEYAPVPAKHKHKAVHKASIIFTLQLIL